ncbi:MAG: aldolase, partial [Acidimicrobiales bacterium]
MLMEHLTDDRWTDLLQTRATRPAAIAESFAARTRRPLLRDGRLFLVAADHTARGVLGVGAQPAVMADRRSLLE